MGGREAEDAAAAFADDEGEEEESDSEADEGEDEEEEVEEVLEPTAPEDGEDDETGHAAAAAAAAAAVASSAAAGAKEERIDLEKDLGEVIGGREVPQGPTPTAPPPEAPRSPSPSVLSADPWAEAAAKLPHVVAAAAAAAAGVGEPAQDDPTARRDQFNVPPSSPAQAAAAARPAPAAGDSDWDPNVFTCSAGMDATMEDGATAEPLPAVEEERAHALAGVGTAPDAAAARPGEDDDAQLQPGTAAALALDARASMLLAPCSPPSVAPAAPGSEPEQLRVRLLPAPVTPPGMMPGTPPGLPPPLPWSPAAGRGT